MIITICVIIGLCLGAYGTISNYLKARKLEQELRKVQIDK